nr:putative reverse transcriptase domain-containing protein [Tanacetum cinerariifolium]
MSKEGQVRGSWRSSNRSFVNTRFSSMLYIDPIKIDTSYEVELADGRVVSTNTVLKGYALNLVNDIFEIDLMPIELGMLDIIIGMDCLFKHDAVIIYGEKVVCIPYRNKTLVVESDKGMSRQKKKLKEKQLEDVPVIRDFPKLFPNDLLGLPPPRQVKFRIDLVPGAAPVARALYRLAPSKMKELLEKGFIRSSLLPREHRCCSCKRKMGLFECVLITGKEEDEAFQLLKQKLCSAPILALPKGTEDFVVYCNASLKGYRAVLMQREKVIAYAS